MKISFMQTAEVEVTQKFVINVLCERLRMLVNFEDSEKTFNMKEGDVPCYVQPVYDTYNPHNNSYSEYEVKYIEKDKNEIIAIVNCLKQFGLNTKANISLHDLRALYNDFV